MSSQGTGVRAIGVAHFSFLLLILIRYIKVNTDVSVACVDFEARSFFVILDVINVNPLSRQSFNSPHMEHTVFAVKITVCYHD